MSCYVHRCPAIFRWGNKPSPIGHPELQGCLQLSMTPVYEGPVLLPNVSTPPRIGGKMVVPLCGPLRQLENATTTTNLSLVSACSPLTCPPGFPFLRLHDAYTMLRAISAISANGILIAFSFYIHYVSLFLHIPASAKGERWNLTQINKDHTL